MNRIVLHYLEVIERVKFSTSINIFVDDAFDIILNIFHLYVSHH